MKNKNTKLLVISLEIRPLEALYPLPHKNVLYSAEILSFYLIGRQGWYGGAYGICASLLYQSKDSGV